MRMKSTLIALVACLVLGCGDSRVRPQVQIHEGIVIEKWIAPARTRKRVVYKSYPEQSGTVVESTIEPTYHLKVRCVLDHVSTDTWAVDKKFYDQAAIGEQWVRPLPTRRQLSQETP